MKRGRKKARRLNNKDESDDDEDPQLYCICRSSQCDSFMIACDACQDWFHGECINVSPKQAECIQTYYCPDCREKDSSLRIEFKNDNSNGKQSYSNRQRASAIASPGVGESEEFGDMLSINSRKRGRKHPQTVQSNSRRNINSLSAQRPETSEDELEVTPSQFASPSSGYSQSNSVSGSYSQRSKYGRMTPPAAYDNAPVPEIQPRWRHLSARGIHAQPCGDCEGCKRTENCGNCDVCRSPKFKQGRSRQRCVYKTCVGSEPIPSRRARMRTSSKISPNQGQLSDFDYESNFDDYSSSRKFVSGPSKSGSVIGSKMRRGDHLPGGLGVTRHIHERGMEPQFSRRNAFPDVGLIDGPEFAVSYGMSPSHRNDRNGSRYSSLHLHPSEMDQSLMRNENDMLGHGDSLGPGDPQPNYESEEDVMLPVMRPCSGPACVKPAVRTRYCSEECQLRHESHNQRPHPVSRFTSAKEEILTPYALSYPDHLYCKHHHRSHTYNLESTMSMQQSGSSISDIYSEIYPPFSGQFVSSNQSANMDYVYDQMTPNQTSTLSSYRRLSSHSNTANSVSDEFPLNYSPYSQNNHTSKNTIQMSHSRKFTGLDDLRVDRGRPHLTGASEHLPSSEISSSDRGNGRMMCIPNRHQQQQPIGNSEGLHPDLSLDAITPTMHSIPMYNGGHGCPDYRVSGANTDISQDDGGAELLSTETNDLLDVDGNSSSGIGPTPSNSAPTFRQGDEYYMMNENENIEINWPASPGGVATASAGTV